MFEDNQTSPQSSAPADTPVQPAGIRELQGQTGGGSRDAANLNLDMILDVSVTVSIEVGRARMSINDLLKLSQGAIIELDRMAGEPLDVLVNGTLVARGEIVVVRDKFGIMLTEVVSPEERLRRLR